MNASVDKISEACINFTEEKKSDVFSNDVNYFGYRSRFEFQFYLISIFELRQPAADRNLTLRLIVLHPADGVNLTLRLIVLYSADDVNVV